MIKLIMEKIIGLKIDIACWIKLRHILRYNKYLNKVDSVIKKNFRNLWRPISKLPAYNYLKLYSGISGIESFKYVPENLYYTNIEPKLNNRLFTPAYADKNFYEKLLPDYREYFPRTILRGINGSIFDENYYPLNLNSNTLHRIIEKEKSYILKPAIESSGGQRVLLFKSDYFDDINSFKILLKKLKSYNGNFSFQEQVQSNTWFSNFHPESLNTLRLVTYRSIKDEEINVLSMVLRFGTGSNIVDNQAAGGMTIGINENGNLNNFLIDKYGRKYLVREKFNFDIEFAVPFFQEIKLVAIEIAKHFKYHRLLGFDIAIDKNNAIKIIEINLKNLEINFLQMNNGPLFKNFTKEIIDFVKESKKILVIGFKS